MSKEGKSREDRDFHEPILDDGDDAAAREVSRAIAKAVGLDDDDLAALGLLDE